MKQVIESLRKEDLRSYQPIPFWSWNDSLEPEKLRQQIQWMKKCGIGGFFMHARNGLKTEYLSEEWMECVAACCEEAEKLGMEAWGYDENGYPSGFVGGKLLTDENLDMRIEYQYGIYDENADVSYRITENHLIRVKTNEPVVENGSDVYLNLYLKKNSSTVDILNPEVVDKFLDATHEKYQEYFGDTFSQKMKGFFTDEPEYYRYRTPYTPMLVQYFQEHYQQDVFDGLGLLFEEKDGYRSFRYRYWTAMQQLMLENFGARIYDWCDEHGVKLTGHYIEESSMGMQLWCCGGVMPFYEYEHIPGIDWLGSDTDNELSPRQLGSVARQLGKKHTLTESFAMTGWDISLADLRRIVGFQFAGGVNLLCHHLLPYSEKGVRKHDHPAHFSDVNPWTEEYFGEFNDYFTRLGYLLSEGEEPVNVAMLHPMRSAYLEYRREKEAEGYEIIELEESLREACRVLSSRGISYHFLDETLLAKHGFVERDTIGCGQCAYTYLVFPQVLTMDKKTEALVREFVMQGGKVLLLKGKPSYLEGEPYEYDYLESNCTLEDIIADQPFSVENPKTEIYCAYRRMKDTDFLFLQNASCNQSYTQTFCFHDNKNNDSYVKSFYALDLLTLETKQLPLTVTLEKNESLLLFPSKENVREEKKMVEVEFQFSEAEVSFEENFLIVGMVRHSKDGVHYSNPMYYGQLFQQLLEERYEGELFLKYEFEIETLPERIFLRTEEPGKVPKLNGHSLVFTDTVVDDRQEVDVTALVRLGRNEYETSVYWKQSKQVYRVLFEEDESSGFRNAFTYDTELESIHLAGTFGVYSHSEYEPYNEQTVYGRNFYIGKLPEKVSELVTDGMPFFRGRFTVSQEVELTTSEVLLKLAGRYLAAEIQINGKPAGKLLFDRSLDISKHARQGKNEISVTYTVGNRNLYGPHHSSGDEAAVGPWSFQEFHFPENEEGMCGYKLYRFFCKDKISAY